MFQNSLPNDDVFPIVTAALPNCTVYAATSTLYKEYGNKLFSTTDVSFVVASPLHISFDFAGLQEM
jgi:hypothetical protein